MLYSEFITKLRKAVQDWPKLTQDKWDGDGSTTVFKTTYQPILDASYQVIVDGVQKTETSQYTLEKEGGLLTVLTAPIAGTKNVRLDYKYVFLNDTEWIEIINSVLSRWRRKLWTMAINEANLTVKDQDDYNLFSLISANVLWVTGVWFKKSSDAEWPSVGRDRNVTYYPEQGILNFRPSFNSSDYYLRIQYLLAYTLGSSAASTFEPNEKYHPAIMKACMAEFWQRFATSKLKETGAVVKEGSYDPAVSIMNIGLKLADQAEKELSKVKPRFPESTIQNVIRGITS